jgi:hypothetical protein
MPNTYIYCPLAWSQTYRGSFIGFKDLLFFIPDQPSQVGYQAVIDSRYRSNGTTPPAIIQQMIHEHKPSEEELKTSLFAMFPHDESLRCELRDYKYFKINNGWFPFTRNITVLHTGKLIPFQVQIKNRDFLQTAQTFYQGYLT